MNLRTAALFLVIFPAVIYPQSDLSVTNIQQNNSGLPQNDRIVFPNVNISIEDQSEFTLNNGTTNLELNNVPDVAQVSPEELSSNVENSIFRGETGVFSNRNFSLSSFSLLYGSFEDLTADLSIGKHDGKLDYLITYYREGSDSPEWQSNTYFNTEKSSDSFGADFIYSLSKELTLNLDTAYNDKSTGLFTNQLNMTEYQTYAPINIGAVYSFDVNSALRGGLDYQYLEIKHKLENGYSNTILNETGADIDYEANFSRDNFLIANLSYNLNSCYTDIMEGFKTIIKDKFPILPNFSVEAGGGFFFYNYKGFFWYPDLTLFYRPASIVTFSAGITGSQKDLSASEFYAENQIEYSTPVPEEKWSAPSLALDYNPLPYLSLHAGAAYNWYNSFNTYSLDQSSGLYEFQSITNIQAAELTLGADFKVYEAFSLSASYSFKQPLNATNLLFYDSQDASIEASYISTPIGLTVESGLDYKDMEYYTQTLCFPPALIWNFSASLGISKNILAELSIDNILNDELFDRPDIPLGGTRINSGLKILL